MEGSPPERDVLLATKLQVPRSRPGLVPRRRLADQLEEGLNHGARALALLDRLDLAAAGQHRVGSLIEIGAVRAMALEALGDEAAATATLTAALASGCPQGYVRVFADEGPAMAAVLGRLIAAQRSDQQAAGTSPAPRLIEQLTSRELEVLAMLAAGRSNQGIASQLVISLDTVKKHVSHLLGKLGAANRTEAVARGRELGLIDQDRSA
jgi:LuxR family maltose regulon positive regulatory protein